MNFKKLLLTIIIATIFSNIAIAAEYVPDEISIPLYITTAGGSKLNGAYSFTFKIYNVPTGGVSLFSQTESVTITNSFGSTILANTGLAYNQSYWLGISMNGGSEMTPRINITKSPYAHRANISERVNWSGVMNSNASASGNCPEGQFMQNTTSAGPQCSAPGTITGSAGSITASNISGWGFYNSLTNFTGNLSDQLYCIYNTATSKIDCNATAASVTGAAGSITSTNISGWGFYYTETNLTDLLDNNYLGIGSDWVNTSGDTINGDLIINGNLTIIGSYINATVTNQFINGSIMPDLDNQFNIGGGNQRWNTLYTAVANASQICIGSDCITGWLELNSTDQNNYTTNISITNGTTHEVTISILGRSDITANFIDADTYATAQNVTGWGFYNNLSNFSGSMVAGSYCVYNGSRIECNASGATVTGASYDQVLNISGNVTFQNITVTRNLSTPNLSITDGGSLWISGVGIQSWNEVNGSSGTGASYDQVLNISGNVTFQNVTVTRNLSAQNISALSYCSGGVCILSWNEVNGSTFTSITLGGVSIATWAEVNGTSALDNSTIVRTFSNTNFSNSLGIAVAKNLTISENLTVLGNLTVLNNLSALRISPNSIMLGGIAIASWSEVNGTAAEMTDIRDQSVNTTSNVTFRNLTITNNVSTPNLSITSGGSLWINGVGIQTWSEVNGSAAEMSDIRDQSVNITSNVTFRNITVTRNLSAQNISALSYCSGGVCILSWNEVNGSTFTSITLGGVSIATWAEVNGTAVLDNSTIVRTFSNTNFSNSLGIAVAKNLTISENLTVLGNVSILNNLSALRISPNSIMLGGVAIASWSEIANLTSSNISAWGFKQYDQTLNITGNVTFENITATRNISTPNLSITSGGSLWIGGVGILSWAEVNGSSGIVNGSAALLLELNVSGQSNASVFCLDGVCLDTWSEVNATPGNITGFGITNVVAKFTDSGVIANSSIADNGSMVNFSGDTIQFGTGATALMIANVSGWAEFNTTLGANYSQNVSAYGMIGKTVLCVGGADTANCINSWAEVNSTTSLTLNSVTITDWSYVNFSNNQKSQLNITGNATFENLTIMRNLSAGNITVNGSGYLSIGGVRVNSWSEVNFSNNQASQLNVTGNVTFENITATRNISTPNLSITSGGSLWVGGVGIQSWGEVNSTSAGAAYDQVLNISGNVTFQNVTVTRNLSAQNISASSYCSGGVCILSWSEVNGSTFTSITLGGVSIATWAEVNGSVSLDNSTIVRTFSNTNFSNDLGIAIAKNLTISENLTVLGNLTVLNNLSALRISPNSIMLGGVAIASWSEISNLTSDNITRWGFYNSIDNVTGSKTDTKICVWDAPNNKINCTYTDQLGEPGTNDGNNYTNALSVDGNGTTIKTINLGRLGMTNLTASWIDLDTFVTANNITAWGFWNNITNFTGTNTVGGFCVYNGSRIECNATVAEVTGASGSITASNISGWGFWSNVTNLSGILNEGAWCAYNGTHIVCNVTPTGFAGTIGSANISVWGFPQFDQNLNKTANVTFRNLTITNNLSAQNISSSSYCAGGVCINTWNEINKTVEGASGGIDAGNITGWGFYNNITNFTGTMTPGQMCTYNGSRIECNVTPSFVGAAGSITASNISGWGFWNNITNLSGTLNSGQWCAYNGTHIVCNVTPTGFAGTIGSANISGWGFPQFDQNLNTTANVTFRNITVTRNLSAQNISALSYCSGGVCILSWSEVNGSTFTSITLGGVSIATWAEVNGTSTLDNSTIVRTFSPVNFSNSLGIAVAKNLTISENLTVLGNISVLNNISALRISPNSILLGGVAIASWSEIANLTSNNISAWGFKQYDQTLNITGNVTFQNLTATRNISTPNLSITTGGSMWIGGVGIQSWSEVNGTSAQPNNWSVIGSKYIYNNSWVLEVNETQLNTTYGNNQKVWQQLVVDPTGFRTNTETNVSFSDANRNFTIRPVSPATNYSWYINGTKCTKDVDSIIMNDTVAQHYFYYVDCNTLVTSMSPWEFPGYAQIATVYWNGSASILGDERHGLAMDWATHEFIHDTIGTRYESGLTGSFNSTGFVVTQGAIDDEDLEFDIDQQNTANVFYRNVSLTWTWLPNQSQYFFKNATNMYYDNNGVLTVVPANQYMAVWVFASNNRVPVNVILGQRTDTTLADAETNNKYESLVLGTLPTAEMKILYRVILRNDASPWQRTQDLRSISNLPGGTFVASDHGALTGLTDDDHTQYLLASGARALTGSWDAGDYNITNYWTHANINSTTACINGLCINDWSEVNTTAFNQNLNTTGNVTFQNMTATRNISTPNLSITTGGALWIGGVGIQTWSEVNVTSFIVNADNISGWGFKQQDQVLNISGNVTFRNITVTRNLSAQNISALSYCSGGVCILSWNEVNGSTFTSITLGGTSIATWAEVNGSVSLDNSTIVRTFSNTNFSNSLGIAVAKNLTISENLTVLGNVSILNNLSALRISPNSIMLGGVAIASWSEIANLTSNNISAWGFKQYDQTLNITGNVTFENLTITEKLALDAVKISSWSEVNGSTFSSITLGATTISSWDEVNKTDTGISDQNLNTTANVTFKNLTVTANASIWNLSVTQNASFRTNVSVGNISGNQSAFVRYCLGGTCIDGWVEVNKTVEGASGGISASNISGWGFWNNITNMSGTLTEGQWCAYNGTHIVCNVTPVVQVTGAAGGITSSNISGWGFPQFDQNLNTTANVTFRNITVTRNLSAQNISALSYCSGGVCILSWNEVNGSTFTSITLGGVSIATWAEVNGTSTLDNSTIVRTFSPVNFSNSLGIAIAKNLTISENLTVLGNISVLNNISALRISPTSIMLGGVAIASWSEVNVTSFIINADNVSGWGFKQFDQNLNTTANVTFKNLTVTANASFWNLTVTENASFRGNLSAGNISSNMTATNKLCVSGTCITGWAEANGSTFPTSITLGTVAITDWSQVNVTNNQASNLNMTGNVTFENLTVTKNISTANISVSQNLTIQPNAQIVLNGVPILTWDEVNKTAAPGSGIINDSNAVLNNLTVNANATIWNLTVVENASLRGNNTVGNISGNQSSFVRSCVAGTCIDSWAEVNGSSGSGNITGFGVVNVVSKFTDSGVIANSSIADNGSMVNFSSDTINFGTGATALVIANVSGWAEFNTTFGANFSQNVSAYGMIANTVLCLAGTATANCINTWAEINKTDTNITNQVLNVTGNVTFQNLTITANASIWNLSVTQNASLRGNNTVGNITGNQSSFLRVCTAGVCIDSWAEVNGSSGSGAAYDQNLNITANVTFANLTVTANTSLWNLTVTQNASFRTNVSVGNISGNQSAFVRSCVGGVCIDGWAEVNGSTFPTSITLGTVSITDWSYVNFSNNQASQLNMTGNVTFENLTVTKNISTANISVSQNLTIQPNAQIVLNGVPILTWDEVNKTGAGISGSGDINVLAKFTASGTIGNSSIADNGSVVNISATTLNVGDSEQSAVMIANVSGWAEFNTTFGANFSQNVSAYGIIGTTVLCVAGTDTAKCINSWAEVNGSGGGGAAYDQNLNITANVTFQNLTITANASIWNLSVTQNASLRGNNTVGNITGNQSSFLRVCTAGICIDSWDEVNKTGGDGGGAAYDQNLNITANVTFANLTVTANASIWNLSVTQNASLRGNNTVGNITGNQSSFTRVCTAGICIDSWAEVNGSVFSSITLNSVSITDWSYVNFSNNQASQLNITGNVTFYNLTVTGNTSLYHLNVTNNASISENLTVFGNITVLNNISALAISSSNVTATMVSAVGIGGAINATAGGTMIGNYTISQNLSVSGNLTINQGVAAVVLSGNSTCGFFYSPNKATRLEICN